ncbi:MAG: hypothetical protein ACREMZ_16525 [Gemmatimonadales bacterium]
MRADVAYLDAPVMALGEAARQLGIPTSTLKHWLDGHHVGERFYLLRCCDPNRPREGT